MQLITVIGYLAVALFPFFFPQYFPWISDIKLNLIMMLAFLAFALILFFVIVTFNKMSLWKYSGYFSILIYIIFIYITGGVNSTFIIFLTFVPLVSVTQFDAKLTLSTGIVSTLLLASMIFWDGSTLNSQTISLHIFHVFSYSLIVYYVYSLVKEILYQRYEKEHFRQKFVELAEINKVKESFLGTMSHQLRSPLTGARWALSEALEAKTGEINKEALKDSYNKIVDAIRILGEILESADTETQKMFLNMKKEPVDLVEVIEDIYHNLAREIANKEVTVVFNKPDSLIITGDKKMLDLGLTNVIDNAIRYSPKGRVIISLMREETGEAKLVVEDTGLGIDPADLEYVFQKFFRGKNALRLDPNESGIGLYTTKRIVELHDGQIKVFSTLGKGTMIEIIFSNKN